MKISVRIVAITAILTVTAMPALTVAQGVGTALLGALKGLGDIADRDIEQEHQMELLQQQNRAAQERQLQLLREQHRLEMERMEAAYRLKQNAQQAVATPPPPPLRADGLLWCTTVNGRMWAPLAACDTRYSIEQ